MITPNLATRPFLNTRPVWLVTAAAGLATLILLGLNLRLFLVSNRALDEETARRDMLVEQLGKDRQRDHLATGLFRDREVALAVAERVAHPVERE